jgi:DNA-binding beta-propeller fold protein YncE
MSRLDRIVVICLSLLIALAGASAARAASVYTTRGGSNPGSVYQLSAAANGDLSLLSPEYASSTGYYANQLAITPAGLNLYVTNTEAASLSQFGISAGGLLSPLNPAGVTVTKGSYPVVASPDGSSLYTAHASPSYEIEQFTIGADGQLAAKSPAKVGTGGDADIVLTPDGRFLYVSNFGAPGKIFEYEVEAGGTLKALSPSFVSAGLFPVGMAVTPDGQHLYAGTESENGVLQYTIGADGQLAPMSPASAPVPEETNTEDLAVTPDGAYLYASDAYEGGIVQFAIGANGALAPLSPAKAAGGTSVESVAVSPDGKSLYAGRYDGEMLQRFAIGAAGTLTATANQLTKTGIPSDIAVSPDQGPTAALTVTAGPAGKPSSFDASGSHDPDGTVVGYDWSFGDGKTATTSGPTTTHVYAHRRNYTAAVTVTDNEGASTTRVFTGHQVLRNGSRAAQASVTFKVFGQVPTITRAKLKPRRFQVGKTRGRGSRLRFRLDVPGPVTEKVERRGHGKWRQLKGNLVLHAKPGANRFAFSGRFKGAKLKPGPYRLVLTPRSEGEAGQPVRIKFTVLAG